MGSLRNHLILFEIWLLTALALCLGATSQSNAQTEPSGTISEIEAPTAITQVVRVGVYVKTVYQLDLASSTYYLDAYLWFKWAGDIDPTGSIEITNLVEKWSATVAALNEEPIILPDGQRYKLIKLEGRFMQPFDLNDYPLDRQKLSVYFEDSSHGIDQLVYMMDQEGSGYGQMLAIPGWRIEGWSFQQLKRDHGSSFGTGAVGNAAVFSTLRFDLEISRPVNFFILKLMLPLVIVLMASWMVLILDPKLVEVRTVLPSTSLVAVVLLQEFYSNGLPDLGYLMLSDRIYAAAYAVIVLVLLRAAWTSRMDLTVKSEAVAARAMDHRLCLGLVLMFAVAVFWIVLAR